MSGARRGKPLGEVETFSVGASNVSADEVTGEADARLETPRRAPTRDARARPKAHLTQTRMTRTTPRARRASRTHAASPEDDARGRHVSRRTRGIARRGLLRRLALFPLLLCSSPRPARGELGVEGHDLSNFQGKHACGAGVRMSTPETVADVARVVAAFPKVRAVGVGHSWNAPLFCAGSGRGAVDVALAKVRSVGRSVTGETLSRLDREEGDGEVRGEARRSLLGGGRGSGAADEDSRFRVDVAAGEVEADAGATVRDLLDFLRDFSPPAPGEAGNDVAGDAANETTNEKASASPDASSPRASPSAVDVLRRLRRRATRAGAGDSGDANGGGAGYTLPAFPWFIDQTIGGAVATATHGSSLRRGSLSSQVAGLEVVLANGTTTSFAETKTPRRIFDAARAHLGRLGAVTRVRLKITKNHPVRRMSRDVSPETFASLVEKASDAFARCADAVDAGADEETRAEERKKCAFASPHLRRLDETQAFWFFPLGVVTEVTFARLDDLEDDVRRLGVDSRTPEMEMASSSSEKTGNRVSEKIAKRTETTTRVANPPASVSVAAAVVAATAEPHAASVRLLERDGVVRDQPPGAPRDATEVWPALANDTFARFWSRQWERSTRENVASGVFPARDSYLTMSETQYDAHDHFAYDQYEFCVPMRFAGRCLRAVAAAARDAETGDVGGDAFGFRSQGLIRFIGEEDALLSPANGRAAGACMYVNLEDFVKYNRADGSLKQNQPFARVVRLLRSETCRGRLHWGKAGWPSDPACFDGAEEYGESWCAFACAARSLDPGDKFVPAESVFASAPFYRERCCDGATGAYLREEPGCACAARAEPGGSCGEAWY